LLSFLDEDYLLTRSVQTGQVTTQVYECGEGAPLLLLHGAGPGIDALINWADTMQRLGKNFRCIAPDLVGFGKTSLPNRLPSNATEWACARAQQIELLMEEYGLARAAMIGNSRGGGATLLEVLRRKPDLCSRAIIMGGAGFPTDVAGSAHVAGKVPNFYGNPRPEIMDQLISLFVTDESKIPMNRARLAQHRFENAMATGFEEAYRTMLSGAAVAPETANALARVNTRLLLMHGACDVLAPLQASLALQSATKEAVLHVLPKAGHWLHIDQPEIFESSVLQFFSN